MIKKEKKEKKSKDEVIVVKRLTYPKMFIILALLMTIDVWSSYIVTQDSRITEMNSLGKLAFSHGVFGASIFFFCALGMIAFILMTIYAYESLVFKFARQQFRMKLFYTILGMYLFVFANNLKVLLNIFYFS